MTKAKAAPSKPSFPLSQAVAKPQLSKKQQLIKMLTGKTAHSLDAVCTKFGWQAHSARAALSGLRKAGIDVISIKSAKTGKMGYRIEPATKADA